MSEQGPGCQGMGLSAMGSRLRANSGQSQFHCSVPQPKAARASLKALHTFG